jgi:hypothetical protein
VTSRELIDLEDRTLIQIILESLKSKKARVRLWQTLSQTNDVNFAQVECVDLVENKAILTPFRNKQFFLSPTPYLYFHSHHRTTLFKTSIRQRQPYELEIKIPEFVKIQEGRGEERKNLDGLSSYRAEIKLEGRGQNFDVDVLDISANGAAITLPLDLFNLCSPGTLITINSAKLEHLDGRIAVIRNKAAYCPDPGKPHVIKYRIGLEIFRETSPDNFLSRFID